jgi:ABC-2 type transport system permease protein
MGLFFVLTALFLWFIEGNYYLPAYRFADLYPFFSLAPWILIFVFSAISMKSFADEFKSGTIENLVTKPLKLSQIILGKFLSIWTIGILMLLPTLIYVYSIKQLSLDGQLDYLTILSGYIGLLLLIGVFSAIGIFSSALFSNQVNAFLVGLFLMFLFYYGFEGLGSFNLLGTLDLFFKRLSLDFHYQNFIKGLIKFSDLIYFISIIILFLVLTNITLKKRLQ